MWNNVAMGIELCGSGGEQGAINVEDGQIGSQKVMGSTAKSSPPA